MAPNATLRTATFAIANECDEGRRSMRPLLRRELRATAHSSGIAPRFAWPSAARPEPLADEAASSKSEGPTKPVARRHERCGPSVSDASEKGSRREREGFAEKSEGREGHEGCRQKKLCVDASRTASLASHEHVVRRRVIQASRYTLKRVLAPVYLGGAYVST